MIHDVPNLSLLLFLSSIITDCNLLLEDKYVIFNNNFTLFLHFFKLNLINSLFLTHIFFVYFCFLCSCFMFHI
jgi:hypothetical protein